MRYTSEVLSPVLRIRKVCRPAFGAVKPLPQSASDTATVWAPEGREPPRATAAPASTAGAATTATGATQAGRRRAGAVAAGFVCGAFGAGSVGRVVDAPRRKSVITTAR